MEEKRRFTIINILVSFLGLGVMGYLFYMSVFHGGLLYSLLLLLLFDGVVSLQVLMLALSMGKRDKNPYIDYKPLINFNIVMLVLYGIGFVIYHIRFIMLVVKVVKTTITLST